MSQFRVLVLAALLLVGSAVAPAAGATDTDTDTASLYVVHGVPGMTADVVVDGRVVQEAAEASAVLGPFEVSPGRHTVSLEAVSSEPLTAAVELAPGESADLVAHRQADPQAPPVLTAFPNDMSPVGPDKSRLVVAHTAAVPPADIRVDGEVLLSNVANAESLTVVVPAATYSVDIVPTAATGPVLFGPVDLPVAGSELTRVFAFGDPATSTMDAVVHRIPLAVEGAAAPLIVATGNGGQAAAGVSPLPFVLVGGLMLLLVVRPLSRRVRTAR